MHRMASGVLAAVLAGSQLGAASLDGWSAFKFGMSPEAARALKGQSFGRYMVDERNQGAMGSTKPASVYGAPYSFYLFFSAFKALNRIELQNEQTTNQAGCQSAFLVLLDHLEKTYGPLSPVYPEHARNASDALPISIVWKKSAGASRYQLATVFLGDETASVWDARRVYGKRYFDLTAAWSASDPGDKAVCLTQLEFAS